MNLSVEDRIHRDSIITCVAVMIQKEPPRVFGLDQLFRQETIGNMIGGEIRRISLPEHRIRKRNAFLVLHGTDEDHVCRMFNIDLL